MSIAAFLCAAILPLPAAEPEGGDLWRFLPSHGNCVYEAQGLLRQWPPEGPKLLWRAEIGFGKSAVVEAHGLAFTAAEIDDQQWALGAGAGQRRRALETPASAEQNRHFEFGPVTSPVIDGDRAYFIPYANFAHDVWDLRCPIVCLKTDGTELWRVDKDVWATEASTPLVVGDTLYAGADNPEHVVLAAFDKLTGKIRWTTAVPSDRRTSCAPRPR